MSTASTSKKQSSHAHHTSWVAKYKPNRLSQMIGTNTHLKQLSSWLSDFTKKKIVHTTVNAIGDHGVGKTLGIELVLKEHGYEAKTLEFSVLARYSSDTSSDLARYLERVVGTQNLDMMISGKQQKRTAIVVDNIDSITANNEKEGLLAVHKYNEKHKLFPLILISTGKHSKLLSKIVHKPDKKQNTSCMVVRFQQPGHNDMIEMIDRITAREEFKIEGVRELITKAQGDMHRLINLLEELRRTFRNRKIIDSKQVRGFCDMINKKDTDVGLFDITKFLLHRFPGMEDGLRLFDSDKVILPLMIHENYPNSVSLRKENLKLKEDDVLDGLMQVAESISYGDVLENHIYGEQLWEMMESYGYFSCVRPSWLITTRWPKNYMHESLNFTSDVNKIYIQKINYAHIKTVRPFFGDRTTQGYLIAGKIAAKLVAENNIDGLRHIFAGYPGIGPIIIEALLKINKVDSAIKTKREKRTKILKKVFEGITCDDAPAIAVIDGDDPVGM